MPEELRAEGSASQNILWELSTCYAITKGFKNQRIFLKVGSPSQERLAPWEWIRHWHSYFSTLPRTVWIVTTVNTTDHYDRLKTFIRQTPRLIISFEQVKYQANLPVISILFCSDGDRTAWPPLQWNQGERQYHKVWSMEVRGCRTVSLTEVNRNPWEHLITDEQGFLAICTDEVQFFYV